MRLREFFPPACQFGAEILSCSSASPTDLCKLLMRDGLLLVRREFRAADEESGPDWGLDAISVLPERMRWSPSVHYTFETVMSFCSIHFAVVQRSKCNTALARFAYQTCSVADDCFGYVDYRCYAPYRVGGCVLLPMGAPTELAAWENFLSAAAHTETRRNAQEGRILDFALPRAVPRELLVPLAAFALLPFVARGMAVRLDIECVEGSDGKPNPHAHAWLSQRVLNQYGFGLKERSWNTLFRRDGGRYVRAVVAARLTLGCAILGIEAYVDPRRNDVRRAGIPEQRLPRLMWIIHNDGRPVEAIEQLHASRELKRVRKASVPAPEQVGTRMTVTNAATYHRDDEEEAAELRERFTDAARKAGYEVQSDLGGTSGLLAVGLTGTAVAFDGRAFSVAQTGTSEDAAIVARFARQLDWPALVVDGSERLADLMAIAAASESMFMVNRAPSAGARDLIARAFYHELKAALACHDPLGVAAKFLAEFETNSASPVGVPVEEALIDALGEGDLRAPADLVPEAAPVLSGEVALPASEVASTASGPDGNTHSVTAGSDMKRNDSSSSEPNEDLEAIPDDFWRKRPDPAVLERNAREVQAYSERQRQKLKDVDETLRRIRVRSSGHRHDRVSSPWRPEPSPTGKE